MSAPGQDPTLVPEVLERVQQALLRGIRQAAENAAMDSSAAEAKDYAAAAKAMSDAYVVLDPALDGTGIPLAHQRELEQMRQDGAQRLEEARAQQAAPATKKRRVSIRRDQHGRAQSYEEDSS